jgi:hypothetical protein
MTNLSVLFDYYQGGSSSRIANFAAKKTSPSGVARPGNSIAAQVNADREAMLARKNAPKPEPKPAPTPATPSKPLPDLSTGKGRLSGRDATIAGGGSLAIRDARPGVRESLGRAGGNIGDAANSIGRKTKALILKTSKTGKRYAQIGWKKVGDVGNLAMKNPGKSAAILGAAAVVGGGGYYLANRDRN